MLLSQLSSKIRKISRVKGPHLVFRDHFLQPPKMTLRIKGQGSFLWDSRWVTSCKCSCTISTRRSISFRLELWHARWDEPITGLVHNDATRVMRLSATSRIHCNIENGGLHSKRKDKSSNPLRSSRTHTSMRLAVSGTNCEKIWAREKNDELYPVC